MFDRLIEILKANPRKIVFTEGPDARILEAADRLKKGGFLTPILIGAPEEVKAAAARAASTSKVWRSSIPRPIPAWMRWSRRWSSCARAR